MDFTQLIKERYAVREYTSKQVEQEKIEKILEAGRVAPTACNNQPQKILVIKSNEGLAKLTKASNFYGAPLVFVVCADHSLTWKRSDDAKDSGDIDASIVTTQMMLQATQLGLGSLWICAFKPDVLTTEFAIPDELEPVNLLAVGYATGQAKTPDRHDTQRKPLAETVFWENF